MTYLEKFLEMYDIQASNIPEAVDFVEHIIHDLCCLDERTFTPDENGEPSFKLSPVDKVMNCRRNQAGFTKDCNMCWDTEETEDG